MRNARIVMAAWEGVAARHLLTETEECLLVEILLGRSEEARR